MSLRHTLHRGGAATAVLALTLLSAGCDDGLFRVTNPGRILDADLNNPEVMKALVTGMSSDLSIVLDNAAMDVAILSDEAAGSGSYFATGLFRRGVVPRDEVNYEYEALHRARFVAESGIERMQSVEGFDFEGNVLTARAHLFAGFANERLGELFEEVTFENSEALPRTAAFERSIPFFQEALRHARLAGAEEIEHAALGGLAQAHLGLGQLQAAADFAAQVPDDFLYVAVYSDNSGRESNIVYAETHRRHEFSAFGTLVAELNDPRAPFTDCREPGAGCKGSDLGADGLTPHFRQEKYDGLGADIPLVKGSEMLLIRAEAALAQNDAQAALALINQARALADLDPFSATGTDEVFTLLKQERLIVLWLEGRRLFDLDRWNDPFLNGGGIVYEGEATRARAYPLSQTECDTNPNVTCQPTG